MICVFFFCTFINDFHFEFSILSYLFGASDKLRFNTIFSFPSSFLYHFRNEQKKVYM